MHRTPAMKRARRLSRARENAQARARYAQMTLEQRQLHHARKGAWREANPEYRRHKNTEWRTKHPLYTTWQNMIQRCTNPNKKAFKHYGARGISVCERWRTFASFAADMGPRPSTVRSLERIDNDGNYEPANCQWATGTQQRLNQRKRKPHPRDSKTGKFT